MFGSSFFCSEYSLASGYLNPTDQPVHAVPIMVLPPIAQWAPIAPFLHCPSSTKGVQEGADNILQLLLISDYLIVPCLASQLFCHVLTNYLY
jgi:hypothetical protein